MNFFEDSIDSPLFIRRYDAATRTVLTSLGPFSQPMVLFNGKALSEILPENAEDLTVAHIEQLAAFKPEVILLGTGEIQIFPAPSLLASLYPARIGIEMMTTDAACRTFNILISEGRNVLAALFV
ncbi:MAG: MTH938/NDUFAF3 family protein [Gammaproteobacteria bacterium]|jgi:uncharacterized protein|nr:MTH938/NDUFAF3 family protein [Gammaproteobacteria bacterium]